MTVSRYLTLGVLAIAGAMAFADASQALTMKECSAKYKEAQKAGTLKGMNWNDFRKAECGDTAAKPATTQHKAVFPTAVSPKYAKEPAGKARMNTCLDQYNANKATNANGGLKWIEKGGGYYSECTKRLKG